MDLLDKIEWFWKAAQAATKPNQILRSFVKNLKSQIDNASLSPEDKGALVKALNETIKDSEPDSNIDADWSARLARLMDKVNYARKGKEHRFLHDVFHACNTTWDRIEQCGHKSHVDKPVGTSELTKK